MKLMSRARVIKFWGALRDSVSAKEAIASLANRPGYEGERTLLRFAQADAGFREGLSSDDIAAKTQWSVKRVERLREWWQSEFGTLTWARKAHSGEPSTGTAPDSHSESTSPLAEVTKPETDAGQSKQVLGQDEPSPEQKIDTPPDEEVPVRALSEEYLNKMLATGPCQAPPDEADVGVIEGWGVPAKKSGDILNRWRRWHREGRHDICRLFLVLRDDLTVRRFPFRAAEVSLNADEWATEFDVKEFHRDIEIGRKYRHWENAQKHDAFIKEVLELSEPSPEVLVKKGEHLAEVGRLFESLKGDVEMVLATQRFETTFGTESDPLFQSATQHCWDVWYALLDIVPRRAQYQALFGELANEMTKSAPQTATEYYATIAARASINLALGENLPRYAKSRRNGGGFALIAVVGGDPPLAVAIGDSGLVDQCHAMHVVLIRARRNDTETRRLAVLTMELRRFLKVLHTELDKAILKRTYLDTTCPECPR